MIKHPWSRVVVTFVVLLALTQISFELWLLPYDKLQFENARLSFLRLVLFMGYGSLIILVWGGIYLAKNGMSFMFLEKFMAITGVVFVLLSVYLIADANRVYHTRNMFTRMNITCYYWPDVTMNLADEHDNDNYELPIFDVVIFKSLEEMKPFRVLNLDTVASLNKWTYRFTSAQSYRDSTDAYELAVVYQNASSLPRCVPLDKNDTLELNVAYLLQALHTEGNHMSVIALKQIPGYDLSLDYDAQDVAVHDWLTAHTIYTPENDE